MRLLPWVLGLALLEACVGPRGEQVPTAAHPAGSERASAREAPPLHDEPRARARQDQAPPDAQTSKDAPAAETSAEADAEPTAPAAPEPEEAATGAQLADVNVEAEAQADPEGEPAQPAANPALLRQGRQVFSNTCMLCHDLGPRIAGLGWTQARMERQIRRGGKRMSAISIEKLPNSKLHALMAYLRTIGAVRGDGS